MKRRFPLWWIAACLLVFHSAKSDEANAASVSPFAPTSAYQERQIEGWRILVHTNLLAETNLWQNTSKLLAAQLYQITRVVPANPLAKIRRIPIWVELSSEQFRCMCFHESRDWLSTHNVNPEKTEAVELSNATTFLSWTQKQPWMVLHELAHGYHHQISQSDCAKIHDCFERAKASKLYDSVLRNNGRHERHYAMNNEKEYFAEMSEAFFGTNDFYPFVREELREHDPEMFKLLQEIWETN